MAEYKWTKLASWAQPQGCKELGHLGGAQSGANAAQDQNGRVEVVPASCQDTFGTSPRGGFWGSVPDANLFKPRYVVENRWMD